LNIKLHNVGKRYNREWIFKNLTRELKANTTYAVVGRNGSGKSTFLKVLSGKLGPSKGELSYHGQSQLNPVPTEKIYRQIAMCAPYLSIYDEFTLNELIHFQAKFKSFAQEIKETEVPKILELERFRNRAINTFSSGMKQRVKLGLAVLSDSKILLLDEPASNLDHDAQDWMNNLIEKFSKDRLTVICTNHHSQELKLCNEQINIHDYKK
jgi:ABC-type multidrug transport system ATPase subunit